MKFLQDLTQVNRDNYHNQRCGTSPPLRNKKRDYLKGKLSEVETNSKDRSSRDLYKDIRNFKKGYQAKVYIVKNEELLLDSNSNLSRWKNYFSKLLNVH